MNVPEENKIWKRNLEEQILKSNILKEIDPFIKSSIEDVRMEAANLLMNLYEHKPSVQKTYFFLKEYAKELLHLLETFNKTDYVLQQIKNIEVLLTDADDNVLPYNVRQLKQFNIEESIFQALQRSQKKNEQERKAIQKNLELLTNKIDSSGQMLESLKARLLPQA